MKKRRKQIKQISAKKRHKISLKLKNHEQVNLVRNEPSMEERPTILIVCEGEVTEPSYFNNFKLSTAVIISIGEGFNTMALVRRAVCLSNGIDYDQVWCVFDADPKPDNKKQKENFNKAIELAKENNFGIAYSNQAFEYWIILHFEDHQGGPMNRSSYKTKLNLLLKPFNLKYKNKLITKEIFELLVDIDKQTEKERRSLAIKRAKRIYDLYDHKSPANEESSTTVFRLVEELAKYI